MSKPTIVLIAGAWHLPKHYQPLLDWFASHGYPTASQKLPSVGAQDPNDKDVVCDTAFIRNKVLLPELDNGKDVVLLTHSYGGCPGSAAAKGLSKAERQSSGQKGGIIGLVYMCAFVAEEGDSLQSKLPGNKLSPWVIINVRLTHTLTRALLIQNRNKPASWTSITHKKSFTTLLMRKSPHGLFKSWNSRLTHPSLRPAPLPLGRTRYSTDVVRISSAILIMLFISSVRMP